MARKFLTPLTPLSLYILLALAQGDLDAVSILEQIAHDSQSTYIPGESSFYKALKRLQEEKMIVDSPMGRGGFTLTDRARRALKSERVRYIQLASLLRVRLS